MTPHRTIGRNKDLVYTDHFTMVFTLKNLPICKKRNQISEKITVWNTNKPGGWDTFKEVTDENDDLEKLASEDIAEPTLFNSKLEKIMCKVNFKCFGKVTFSNRGKSDRPLENLYDEKRQYTSQNNDEKIKDVENKISDLLVERQRKDYEKKLLDLKTLKESKGKCAASFKLKAKINGEKKEK